MTVASLWKALDQAGCGQAVGQEDMMDPQRKTARITPWNYNENQRRYLRVEDRPSLAVDLSIWICESLTSTAMNDYNENPTLQLVFSRTMKLLSMGIKLIYVIEGKRRIRYRIENNKQQEKFRRRRSGTSFWKACKQCEEMLEMLGVPVVRAKAEGEALCALLNLQGIVDGVISNDGDCLLFGAKVVYTKFSIDNLEKGCVMRYDASSLCALTEGPSDNDYNDNNKDDGKKNDSTSSSVSLSRDDLIAFALLTGSDLAGDGLAKVGHKKAVRFIRKCKLNQPLSAHTAAINELKSWARAVKPIVETDPNANKNDNDNEEDSIGDISDDDDDEGDNDCGGDKENNRHQTDKNTKTKQKKKKKKQTCCSRCSHAGSKRSHEKDGCEICGTEPGEPCYKLSADDKFRKSLREKALALRNPKFDPTLVVNAYMQPNDNQLPASLLLAGMTSSKTLRMEYPKLRDIVNWTVVVKGHCLKASQEYLKQSVSRLLARTELFQDATKKTNQGSSEAQVAAAHQQRRRLCPRERPVPKEVTRKLVQNGIDCYEVCWIMKATVTDKDGDGLDGYEFSTVEPQDMMARHHPQLVDAFKKAPKKTKPQGDGEMQKRREFLETLFQPDAKEAKQVARLEKEKDKRFFDNIPHASQNERDTSLSARVKKKRLKEYRKTVGEDVEQLLRFAGIPTKSKKSDDVNDFDFSSIESGSLHSEVWLEEDEDADDKPIITLKDAGLSQESEMENQKYIRPKEQKSNQRQESKKENRKRKQRKEKSKPYQRQDPNTEYMHNKETNSKQERRPKEKQRCPESSSRQHENEFPQSAPKQRQQRRMPDDDDLYHRDRSLLCGEKAPPFSAEEAPIRSRKRCGPLLESEVNYPHNISRKNGGNNPHKSLERDQQQWKFLEGQDDEVSEITRTCTTAFVRQKLRKTDGHMKLDQCRTESRKYLGKPAKKSSDEYLKSYCEAAARCDVYDTMHEEHIFSDHPDFEDEHVDREWTPNNDNPQFDVPTERAPCHGNTFGPHQKTCACHFKWETSLDYQCCDNDFGPEEHVDEAFQCQDCIDDDATLQEFRSPRLDHYFQQEHGEPGSASTQRHLSGDFGRCPVDSQETTNDFPHRSFSKEMPSTRAFCQMEYESGYSQKTTSDFPGRSRSNETPYMRDFGENEYENGYPANWEDEWNSTPSVSHNLDNLSDDGEALDHDHGMDYDCSISFPAANSGRRVGCRTEHRSHWHNALASRDAIRHAEAESREPESERSTTSCFRDDRCAIKQPGDLDSDYYYNDERDEDHGILSDVEDDRFDLECGSCTSHEQPNDEIFDEPAEFPSTNVPARQFKHQRTKTAECHQTTQRQCYGEPRCSSTGSSNLVKATMPGEPEYNGRDNPTLATATASGGNTTRSRSREHYNPGWGDQEDAYEGRSCYGRDCDHHRSFDYEETLDNGLIEKKVRFMGIQQDQEDEKYDYQYDYEERDDCQFLVSLDDPRLHHMHEEVHTRALQRKQRKDPQPKSAQVMSDKETDTSQDPSISVLKWPSKGMVLPISPIVTRKRAD